MAEFVAEEGKLLGLVLTLRDADVWTIGRDPESSDLVVEDPKVSRKHLICRKTEEGYILENLSLTNPTKVNEDPVLEPRLLHEGDKVSIGSTTFHFYMREAPKVEEEVVEIVPTFSEGDVEHETLFKNEEENLVPQVHFDLSASNRFVFKVVLGPNTGAELALDLGRDYMIGTDTTSCDIVFHDLSVSRQHARLSTKADGLLFIEDLDSRNGCLIDREKVSGKQLLSPNTLVTIGTSAFLIIDREAPLATIAAPLFEDEEEQKMLEAAPTAFGAAFGEEPPLSLPPLSPPEIPEGMIKVAKKPLPVGNLILSLLLVGLVVLFGLGIVSLFQVKEVEVAKENYDGQIRKALSSFSGVQFTFNSGSGHLFLRGHVGNGIEKGELLYNLKPLSFIRCIDDYIVDDEAIWEEMNILLGKNREFDGVTLQSPAPGQFVVLGYLDQNSQFSHLQEFLNLNFPYLNLLTYNVLVKEEILSQVSGLLLQGGFNGVTPDLTNGDLTLTGYINVANGNEYENVLKKIEVITGIHEVRNYVVMLLPEQAVVDLNKESPGAYTVTGYSKHGCVNVNVVINGRILMRGDCIDGMTVVSIQAKTIFLEKDGLKYKIEYNCKST